MSNNTEAGADQQLRAGVLQIFFPLNDSGGIYAAGDPGYRNDRVRP